MTMPTVKIGWFRRDSVRGTTDVLGSVSQYQAPNAVKVDITKRITAKLDKIFLNISMTIDKINSAHFSSEE